MTARRKMAALFFSLVVIGGVWALADSVEKPSLRIIADTDTPVPGQGGGTFAGFFQLTGVDPDISGRNIVFGGCCPTGVYGWFDGELRVIANLDSTFPGTDNPLGFDFADGSTTVRSCTILTGAGSAPALSTKAMSLACSTVKLPEICPRPPGIRSRMTGAV